MTTLLTESNSFAASLVEASSTALPGKTTTDKPGNNLVGGVASEVAESFRDDDEIVASDAPRFDFVGFDHLSTGFPLDGRHTSLDCQSCHTDGVFNELPTQCLACHNGGFATGKSINHITTNEDCGLCHNTFGFEVMAVSLFDHNLIGAAPCLSCHDGISAIGKGPLHVEPSADTCEDCHTFFAWSPAQFDHVGITQPCTTCHIPGGTAKRSKTGSHINTTDVCQACHTNFINWIPANVVDHTEVIGICSTCHDGTIATGPGTSITHASFTNVCNACHTTQVWLPEFFLDHDEIKGSCISCHDGVIATGKIASHVNTSDNCEQCHNVTIFAPVRIVNHNEVIGVCSACHDGTIAIGKHATHPPTLDECDVCHTSNAWLPVFGTIDHSAYVNNCISCHDTVTASGKSAVHINTTNSCELCHEVFPAQWTPVAAAAVNHAVVIGSCIACHDSVIASGKSDVHIPTTDLCGACHQQPPAQWTPVDINAVDHAEVTGGCFGCHDGIIASGKSASHINASNNCDACHAKAPARWAPVLPAAVDHAEVNGSCISCHDTITASGKSASHIASSIECQTCHDQPPAVWTLVAPDRVDHSQVRGSCVSCHDTVIASGKSATHMLTSNVCEACHDQGPAKWTPLVVGAFNHVEALGACESCHDGIIATGKHAFHISTIEDCNVCHSTAAWLPSAVDHTSFVGNCLSCHNGTNASGKNVGHIDSSELCEKCHVVFPGLWASVAAQAVDHTQVNGTCFSCHNAVNASGKSSSHIKTSELCDTCHKPVPALWTPVAVASIDHAQVIGTCVSCHDTLIASGKSNAHMPTTDNCGACHEVVPSTWIPLLAGAFSHAEVTAVCSVCHDGTTATAKHAAHIVTVDECGSCHSTAAWLPAAVDHSTFVNNCISCHDGIKASGKGSSGAIHISSSDQCQTCHDVFPIPWVPSISVDHNQVVGTCVSCHDSVIASGRSISHIATDTACETCHQVPPAGWVPVLPQAVDHTKVLGSCISCHDTVTASGKSTGHIETTNVCEACHKPVPAQWTPVTPDAVDHAQIVGSCASCHDGIVASGKSAAHISSTEFCDACHLPSPALWVPVAAAAVDHTQTIGVCSICHDGTVATGKSTTHIATTSECDTCHNSNAWVPAAVDHSTIINNCVSCHDGTAASGKGSTGATHINSTDLCETCHEVFPATWPSVLPAAVDHLQVLGICSSCHNAVIASGKTNAHMPTSNICDICHAVPPAAWVPVAAAAVDHAQVVGVCSVCHDGGFATGKSANHIATTQECDSCHDTVNWLNITVVDHTGFTNNCFSCHDGVNASGKSTSHFSTSNTCDACHKTFPATWTPVANLAVDHLQVLGNCVTCHDGLLASGKSAAHIPSSDTCNLCHQQGPKLWTPVAPAAVDHTQVIGTCIGCHDGIISSGRSNLHMSTTTTCQACHGQPPDKWAPLATGAFDHSQALGACATCHNGITATGKSNLHMASTDVCEACHGTPPINWSPLVVGAFSHTEVLGACATCHNSVTATGKNPLHITTSQACDVCHTTNAWVPANVDHSGFSRNCITCHNGTNASGKSTSHIASSDTCDLCHAISPAKWTPVASAAVDHSAVLGTCITCHVTGGGASPKSTNHPATSDTCDACHAVPPQKWLPFISPLDHNEVLGTCVSCHRLGGVSSGKPNNHINTTDNCQLCHNVPPQLWTSIIKPMNHVEVMGACVSCHNGVIATARSITHPATTVNCVACHTITPLVWTPIISPLDHNEVTGSCVSCHTPGGIATPKSANHPSTSNLCEACHTVTPLLWKPVISPMNHVEVLGSCVSCHTPGGIATPKSANHLSTSNLCEACHTVTPLLWKPVISPMNHVEVLGSCVSCHTPGGIATPKSNTHPSTSNSCELCHTVTPLLWTPVISPMNHVEVLGSCVSCHTPGGIATPKSNNHPGTSNTCELCHTVAPLVWTPIISPLDHNQVTGSCVSCHVPGGIATPKSNNHPGTSNNCELCHTVAPLVWTPVISPLDHNQVTGSCVSCHTPGGIATPKSATHASTSNVCEACHSVTPLVWRPVISPMNHVEVLGSCVSCHSPGGIAPAKSTNHPNTSDLCEACHTTIPLQWKPFITPLDHAQVIGTCLDCHGMGGIGGGKPGGHPLSTDACELCHSIPPTPWGNTISPLDHAAVIGTCVSCHTSGGVGTAKSGTHPSTSNNCELCHTISPLQWTPFITPLNHNEVLGQCVSCHITGGVASGKSAGHPATSDVCEVCHNVPPLTWLPFITPLDHAEVIGTCVSCHTPGGVASPKSGNHPPTTDICEACHDVPPVSWSNFITPLDHAEVLGTCVICHSTGGVATPKSAGHPTTTDLCDACHFVPPLTWLPFITPVDHNEVLGNCVSCHTPGGVGPAKSGGHPLTTDLCDACHNVPPFTWLPFITPLDHLETFGTCVSCHSAGGIASAKPAGHPLTTDVCEACHSIPPTPWSTVITPLDHSQVLGSCVSCHVSGGVASPKSTNHPPTSDLCEACHDVPPTSWSTLFLPFAHSEATIALCTDCHATGIATPVNAGHCTPLGGDCDLCHDTISFANPTADCVVIVPPVVPGAPPAPAPAPPAPAPPAPAPPAPPAPGMGGPGGGMGM